MQYMDMSYTSTEAVEAAYSRGHNDYLRGRYRNVYVNGGLRQAYNDGYHSPHDLHHMM
jgi:hypothetical protein